MSTLRREIGLPGAVLLGLGSMVGTGVFVSLALTIADAEWGVLAAIVIAAALALANALSSAQLAAAHPVSGGTYEYGRRYLAPWLGFAAGWTFLCAKSASAATAAIGCAAVIRWLLEGAIERGGGADALGGVAEVASRALHEWWTVPALALLIVVVLTLLVAGGIRRSNRANAVIVSITLASLAAFVVMIALQVFDPARRPAETAATPAFRTDLWSQVSTGVLGAPSAGALLGAAALMFVAFTGYGRLATLGEEVREPRTVIPRAIVITMIVVTAIYLAVAWAFLHASGAGIPRIVRFGRPDTLDDLARSHGGAWLGWIVSIGGVTAMLGVLLNLLLGLSRVLLAMARHGDAPAPFSRIDSKRASPVASVLACGAGIAVLASIGDVVFAWSLSAFTVLLYYAITNAAALRLPAADRRYPRWVAAAGLVACLALAFWVQWQVWAAGTLLLAAGFVLRAVLRSFRRPTDA